MGWLRTTPDVYNSTPGATESSARRLRCALCEAYLVTNRPDLIDGSRCFQTVRELRWPDWVACPHRGSRDVVKDGMDDTQRHRQWYDRRGSAAWKETSRRTGVTS